MGVDWHPVRAGVGGIVIAAILALFAPPPVAIGAGAVVVAGLVYRVEGYRQYAWAGTVFALGLAAVVMVLPGIADAYTQTGFVALAGFGALSLVILLVRMVVRLLAGRAIGRVTSDTAFAEEGGKTGAAVLGTLTMAWGVLKSKERIARSGVVGALAPVAGLLDLTGMSVHIPWPLVESVDLTLLTFVGAVLVGFHTLSSWHAFFHLRKTETAQAAKAKGKDAAAAAGAKSKDLAASAKDRSGDALSGTKETVADRAAEADVESVSAAAENATERSRDLLSGAKEKVASDAGGDGESGSTDDQGDDGGLLSSARDAVEDTASEVRDGDTSG